MKEKILEMLVSDNAIKLLASLLVGGLIGLEREYRSKSAGLRTFSLICLGSCMFTIMSLEISPLSPDRIAANIVTGIGFLGAGVIFKQEDRVKGLTTAVIIWITSALGMAIGDGHILLSVLGAVLVLVVLTAYVSIEKVINRLSHIRSYRITYQYSPDAFEAISKTFKKNKLKARISSQQVSPEGITTFWDVRGSVVQHDKLIADFSKNPIIKELAF
jgi:putative Mg2+ transporter-C (MgtC) family protein